jgi:hypothetical protein
MCMTTKRINLWNKQNPERANEHARKWYQANKEKAAEIRRNWRLNNPDKVREYSNDWKQEHPEAIKESKRQWALRNVEKLREKNRARRAAKTNTVVTLSEQEATEIMRAGCFFCHSHTDLTIAHDTPIVKGGNTTRGNVFCLCRSCNSKMHAFTLKDMLKQSTLPL